MKNKILGTNLNICILININDDQTWRWIYKQFYFFERVGSSKIMDVVLPKKKKFSNRIEITLYVCVCVCC